MGATLAKPVTSTVIERYGGRAFRVGIAEMNGWRNNMEDAHVVNMSDDAGFFGVLDGHGGATCSAWCAQRLHEKLDQEGYPPDDAAAKALFLCVDQEYLDTEQESGSTAATCLIRRPATPGEKYKLHVINAGDSRVILSRADGTIVDGGGSDQGLSTDHKPDHPSERERIYRCGGTVADNGPGPARVNGDLSVSRGFGDANYKRTGGPGQEDHPVTADPEMGHFECDPSDFVIICCDGVSEGRFANPEVCELAAKVLQETGGDAGRAAEAVIQRAEERDSKDNITCMIVLMGGVGPDSSMDDGRHVYEMGKTTEFNPCSVLGSDNSGYAKAYESMCTRAGVTMGDAVEQRYGMLQQKQAAGNLTEEELEELQVIGNPEGAEGGEERKAWFQNWAQELQAHEGGSEGGMGPGGLGGSDQQEMMQMLMAMMMQRGGGAPRP